MNYEKRSSTRRVADPRVILVSGRHADSGVAAV